MKPSDSPTSNPTSNPSSIPSSIPSVMPSQIPTLHPSFLPSSDPSHTPSFTPSEFPSFQPSQRPSSIPTVQPSLNPTLRPSQSPSIDPLVEIDPPEPLNNGQFGTSISITTDKIYISAYGNGPGAVYIFDHFGAYQNKIVASDGVFGDEFGSSLAALGDDVVVGAPKANNGRGSVYYFASGSTETKLAASDTSTAASQEFGTSIAISSDKIIIGASKANFEQGAAYIFDATTLTEDIRIQHPSPNFSDRFGVVAAISGQRIFVGAERASSIFSGSVFVFDLAGNHILSLSGSSPGEMFGTSLSVNGATLLVGSPRKASNGSVIGSASIYTLDSAVAMTSATLVTEIVPSDGIHGSNFGISTFVQTNKLYVSADQAWNGDLGKLYVFDNTGAQTSQIVHPDGVDGDFNKFGATVAADNNMVITAAIEQDSVNFQSSGRAYILRFPWLL